MSLKKSRFIKGIILAPDNAALDGIEGEIKVDSSTGKIQVTLKDGVNPSASREIVTSSQTQTLTNKTLTSPVLDTGVSGSAIDIDGTLAANSDTKIASQKAVKTYVDAQIGSKDEADEIIYDNTTSGLVATNVQTAIDEVDGNVDNLVTLSGVALDSTTLGTFTGTTIPDSSTIKSAIQSLETSHESHTGASSGVHGVTGSVVGTSDSQALTNKTIDADLNTISNIENADIKVGAAIARAKLASGTANRVVVNDATGVQVDAAAITASRALVSDANGIPTHSSTTSTEIGHLSGVTSAIQTQLDGKVDESGGTLTSGSVITPARLDVKQDTKANLTTYALTATNGQIVYATDTKEMFQVIDGLLEGIGGGEGVGGTDILFAQTFETAALTDFTQTGLNLSTSNPLHGEISALLTHDASVNQLFKQVIPVDNKFRNQTMVLRLDVKSNASAGNVVINIYDETNAANIVASEQLQLSNDVNGTKNSVGFTIPETCASLSYTITALPEAGSPVTRIDDIICELAETALLETAVEVPVITAWQSYTPTFQGFGTPTNIEFEWRQVGENAEIRGKFLGGAPTVDEARVTLPAGLTSAGTNLIPSIQIIGSTIVNNTGSISVFQTLVEPSVNYVSFGFRDATRTPLTKLAGNIISANALAFNFTASVPCAGLSATTTKTIPLTQSGLVQEGDSFILTRGNAGQSITGNVTNIPFIAVSSKGSKISFTGSTFSVSETGIYHIDGSIAFNSNGGSNIYLYADGVRVDSISSESNLSIYKLSQSRELQSGINYSIRTSRSGTLDNISAVHYLIVSYQGSLKQIAVSSDQKLRIPTSELRFEGASTRGSTATAIVKFDTLAKIRGDAFTVESDSVLGTRITMKKAGKLDISSNLFSSVDDRSVYISKNQVTLTAIPSGSETMAFSAFNTTTTGSPVIFVSYSGFVQIGDVFRIVMNGTPTAEVTNQLNLAFQEQDISVSVTNTLPQFSDSDSYVRVATGNGFGSSATTIRRFASVTSNVGTDILYADSATAGASFTVQSAGVYNISYTDVSASGTPPVQISINGSAITISNIPVTSGGMTISAQPYLQSGDIITVGSINPAEITSASSSTQILISKVGKPNVTGVDVTPFVNVPQPVSQVSTISQTATFGNVIITGNLSTSSGSGIYAYNSSTGVYTALKSAIINVSASFQHAAAATSLPTIRRNSVNLSLATSAAVAGEWASASAEFQVSAGDTFDVFNLTASTTKAQRVTVSATALSDQILTAPETFSTDTASLVYSSTYTLTTLSDAPVGTYITFTYAANTNTRTQTTTRPTQTDADMNANGIQLFTRAYNAASTAGNPAAIAIQIGKGLKGKSLDLYKSAGKVVAGSLDYVLTATTEDVGLRLKEYNEVTGILLIDAGLREVSTVVTSILRFSDITSQTSGYLVINASKNPALTGIGLNRIAARATSTAGGAIGTTNTLQSFAEEVFDTNGAWNGNTFTAPETGYYQVSAGLMSAVVTISTGGGFVVDLYKNGALYSTSRSIGNGAANIYQAIISDVMFLRKDDTISLYSRSSVATTQNTTAGYNFISISKVSV